MLSEILSLFHCCFLCYRVLYNLQGKLNRKHNHWFIRPLWLYGNTVLMTDIFVDVLTI